ncbi:tRNA (guanosine(37)-N1)-methyltransferase TrmD, partial [candidate division WWE3 bacterium CG_4_9_14_3_um_filter_34_6]
TIFPDMFDGFLRYGIINQGIKSNLLDIKIHDLRDYAEKNDRHVDDRPYGGGAGMILMPAPIFKIIKHLKSSQKSNPRVIFLSPKGKTFSQKKAEQLSKIDHIILICGRYEGIDQRVIDNLVDEEVSVGNYVLSGGEVPALTIIDAVSRLIPGVIKNEEFNKFESFSNPLDRKELDFPQYTRPEDFNGHKVPKVLLSGNHEEIRKWRESQ